MIYVCNTKRVLKHYNKTCICFDKYSFLIRLNFLIFYLKDLPEITFYLFVNVLHI